MRIASLFVALCCSALFGVSPASAQQPNNHAGDFQRFLVPLDGDTGSFIRIKFGPNWTGPEHENLKFITKEHPKIGLSFVEPIAKLMGVEPKEIDTINLAMKHRAGVVMLFEISDKQAADRLFAGALPEGAKDEIGTTSPRSGLTGIRVAERLIALGARDAFRAVVAGKASGERFVEALWKTVEKDPFLVVSLAPSAINPGPEDVLARRRESPAGYDVLRIAERNYLTVDASKGLKFEFKFRFKDAAQSEAASKFVPTALKDLDRFLGAADEEWSKGTGVDSKKYPRAPEVAAQMKTAIAATRKALAAASVVVDGESLLTTIEIETERPVSTVVLLQALAPPIAQ